MRELEDIVRDNSQGMMPSVITVSNMVPNCKPMTRPLIAEHDNIRSIEDDVEGFSVIGLDNPWGSVVGGLTVGVLENGAGEWEVRLAVTAWLAEVGVVPLAAPSNPEKQEAVA